jgi:integrase
MQATQQLSFAAVTSTGKKVWPKARVIGAARSHKRRRLTPELVEFARRAIERGYSPITAREQGRTLQGVLKVASTLGGRRMSFAELAQDPFLLAGACTNADRRGRGDGRLRKSTLHSRRVAVRTFLRLMEGYLEGSHDTLAERFETALHDQCELVGVMYRFKDCQRQPRELYTPSRSEIEALLREASTHQGPFQPVRDVAFLMLLASTGLRVSSALNIDGQSFYRLDGDLWVRVREKRKAEPQQVRIVPELRAALERYILVCNRFLAEKGSKNRIGFGLPGPFWRSPPAGPFKRDAATMMVRRASRRVCSREFGPHAIRRFVTQELTERLPRSTVLDVLRWDSTQSLDNHYAPRPGKYLSPDSSVVPVSPGGKAEHEVARRETI